MPRKEKGRLELRVDMARKWLGDPNVSVAEVAFALGFGDQSAFHRAFLRWTGKTPGQFRREAGCANPPVRGKARSANEAGAKRQDPRSVNAILGTRRASSISGCICAVRDDGGPGDDSEVVRAMPTDRDHRSSEERCMSRRNSYAGQVLEQATK